MLLARISAGGVVLEIGPGAADDDVLRALYGSRDEEDFWRGVSTAPADTLQSLKRKFRDLEDRLGQMEGQVTSGDFDLHRKFRDLDR